MTASPYTLASQLQTAKNGLEDAQITLCGAVTVQAEAKRALELAEAHKLCEGVEGKNEKERAAVIIQILRLLRKTSVRPITYFVASWSSCYSTS